MGQLIEIQPLLLPKSGICTEEKLYFRSENLSTADYTTWSGISLKCWDSISFNTYFNSFSLAKWHKYTCLDTLFLKLCLKGKFQVSLMGYSYRNGAVISNVLSIQTICGSGLQQIISFPSSDCLVCAFSLRALEDGSIFYSGAYCCNNSVVARDIYLALNVCTYHREQYIKDTLHLLCQNILDKVDSPLYKHMHVFITDNGKSLQLNEFTSKYIHLNSQDGYGSAGGFARGQLTIMDSMDEYRLTHMIFMDDDILIDPAVLVRTFWFLRCLKETYSASILGGELLKRNFPTMQVEAGAQWLDGKIFSTKPNLDLQKLEHILFNELEESVNYQGWWYCCVPLNHELQFPLPVYFHRDDVEFGLRYNQFIYLNGIAVWHDEFESKPYSQNEYYDMRNKLIVNAIHCNHYHKRHAKKDIIKAVFKKILTYRYREALLILAAVDDYCAGVDWILNLDNKSHNEELRQKGYCSVPLCHTEIPFDQHIYETNLLIQVKENKLWKAVHAIVGYLIPTQETTIVPMFSPSICCFYRKRYIQNYNSFTESFYITKRNFPECMLVLAALFKELIRINQTFDSAGKDWKKRYSQLITANFWKEKLQIAEEHTL